MDRNDLLAEIVDIERTFSWRDRYIRPEYLLHSLERIGIYSSLTRAQLLELGRQSGQLWMVRDSQRIHLNPPFGDYVPRSIEKCVGRFDLPPVFVSDHQRARLVGRGALGLTNAGQIILETTDNADLTPYKRNNAKHLMWDYGASFVCGWGEADVLDDGPYFHLAGRWSQNYFHWLLDYLPQLPILEEYRQQTGANPTIILSSSPPDWLVESLSYFGFGPEDWIEWNGGCAIMDRLVIGTHTRYGFFPSIDMIERVRETLRPRSASNQSDDPTKILISRSDADERRLLNEAEVMRRLRPFGVERFVLSELSFQEQIELFSTADTIIAPHGAGLVNMVFADSPRIIELMGSHTNPCYYCLASALDYEYTCVDAEPRGLDMRVDPDQITALLNE